MLTVPNKNFKSCEDFYTLFDGKLLNGEKILQDFGYNNLKEVENDLLEQIEKSSVEDDFLLQYESTTEDIQYLLDEFPTSTVLVTVNDFGWRNQSGYKIISLTGDNFIHEIFPDTDISFQLFKESDPESDVAIRAVCHHHDSPMGESYYITPLTPKMVSRMYQDSDSSDCLIHEIIEMHNDLKEFSETEIKQMLKKAIELDSSEDLDLFWNYSIEVSNLNDIKEIIRYSIESQRTNALEELIHQYSDQIPQFLKFIKKLQILNTNSGSAQDIEILLNDLLLEPAA